MGTGRHASAISAGALALALSGGTPLLAAGPAWAADCVAHGPLSGVANGLCQVVDGVTDVVDEVTGGTLSTVTDSVDSKVSGATGAVGGAGAAVTPTPSATGPRRTPSPTATAPRVSGGGLGGTVLETCLPLLAGSGCGGEAAEEGRPRPGRTPKPEAAEPGDSAPDSDADSGSGTLPEYPRPPENRPHFIDVGDPAEPVDLGDEGRVVRVEEAELPLLWPGQLVPALTGEARREPARPRQPYDPVATALTAALLLSAVLTARVVAARRAREAAEPEGLPLSGLPMASSRTHRLA
ncbi:hypothetical protein Aph01nite_30520 [Acrocarpospora phusangensis]|uniref:Chaplin domain-containing protein n=1 Tax=Acrocarpospora phusangensis TaxID=1070424 RepID=A0A919Q9D0_9ACTN|nr:hypothetical protein [Acrocarpospora phusangensis]GIH24742.1 hypothetical protein Aph01nite_30520 [Acrocarpospora phusangensis]